MILMLQHKDIYKVSELKSGFTPRWLEPDFIFSILQSFSFSSLCKSLAYLKVKGYSFQSVFSILTCLPFLGQGSVNALINSPISSYIDVRKDSFYRLLNKPSIDWRSILWLFVNKFIGVTAQQETTPGDSPKCLTVDDSLLEKTGKCIEGVSRMWDHVTHRYVLGFKLLVITFWDGTSCIPVDFSIHREKGKNKDKPFGLKQKELKKQYTKKRDRTSYGNQRVQEADTSKIDSAVKMIKNALSKGLEVEYLLMDSWFTCWAFVEQVKKAKKPLHLIGMYKTATTKFDFRNQQLTTHQVRQLLGKKKRCKKLRLYYKEAVVEWKGEKVKLFFSQQGKNGKWKVFLSTNTGLSFIKMVEIYQIRWGIEVFFKESKQMLNLGKCQSNDFDAQIAHTTITMIQHILLTLRYRFDKYETKGALFNQMTDQVQEYRLNERLWGLLIELIQLIEVIFEGADLDEIITKFINDERASEFLKRFLEPPNYCTQVA